MDIIIPDSKTYSDFTQGQQVYAYPLVLPGHEEYEQINEGCELNVFHKTNTSNTSIKGIVVKRNGPLPTTPQQGHEAHQILIRKI